MDREPSPFSGDDEYDDEEVADILRESHSVELSCDFFLHDFAGHRDLGDVAMLDPRDSRVDDLVALGPTGIHVFVGPLDSGLEPYDVSDMDVDVEVDAVTAVESALASAFSAVPVEDLEQVHLDFPYQAAAPPARTDAPFRHVGG